MLVSCVLSGCGEESPPGPQTELGGQDSPETPQKSWPEGAVLAVGDQPILVSEVDRVGTWVKFLHPENTTPSLRRQALTHLLLNRAMLTSVFPERRKKAHAEATKLLAGMRDGSFPGESQAVTGTWSDLGLGIWGETRDLEEGIWSEPIELVGRYVLLRRDAFFPGLVPAADKYTVSIIDFPYTAPDFTRQDLELSPQLVQLTIIDPEWEDLVPNAWGQKLPEHWFTGPQKP